MENSLETQEVINYIQGRINMSPPDEKCNIEIDEDIVSKKIDLPVEDIHLIMENLLNKDYQGNSLVFLSLYHDKNVEIKLPSNEDYDPNLFKLDVGKKYRIEINQKVWGRRIYFDSKAGYLWFKGKKLHFKPSRQRKFLECVCNSEGEVKGIEIDFLKKEVCNSECNVKELLRSLVKEIGKKIREEWKIHNPFSFKEEKVFFIPVSKKSLEVFSAF